MYFGNYFGKYNGNYFGAMEAAVDTGPIARRRRGQFGLRLAVATRRRR